MDLEEFIKEASTGLSKPLEEGDYDGLVAVMGHLMRVKERQAMTDTMFQPLKEAIALLSTYGVEMSEKVHLQLQVSPLGCRGLGAGCEGTRLLTLCWLQELPEQWDSTKKLCLRVKQNAAPLQANEVNIIRRKCQQFEVPALGLGSLGKPPLLSPAAP